MKRCFAFDKNPPTQIIRDSLGDVYIGFDSFGLYGAAGRREVACCRQTQGALAICKRNNSLHRAFAKRPCADDCRAFAVL